jgi:hypothetical protein
LDGRNESFNSKCTQNNILGKKTPVSLQNYKIIYSELPVKKFFPTATSPIF